MPNRNTFRIIVLLSCLNLLFGVTSPVSNDIILPDQKVNEDAGGSDQENPAIAMTSDSLYIITWQDNCNGNYDIYAQRFDAAGNALGSSFKVNDDPGITDQYYPSVDINDEGAFVIVWADVREDHYNQHIYAQLYDAQGNKVNDNFRVNAGRGPMVYTYSPVKMRDDGSFVIIYEDYFNHDYSLYAHCYDAAGVETGSYVKVNNDIGLNTQQSPALDIAADGSFVVVWSDSRNSRYMDLYAQRFDAENNKIGVNFKVIDSPEYTRHLSPDISLTNTGKMIISWEELYYFQHRICVQQFDTNGLALDSCLYFTSSSDSLWKRDPSIGLRSDNSFVITWIETHDNTDIYVQNFDSSGNMVGANILVNDDENGSWQTYPSVAVGANDQCIIIWEDERNGNQDIFAQKYDSPGTEAGSNFKLINIFGSSGQYDPGIAVNPNGKRVIAWRDQRNDNDDIYAQLYDSDGDPVGDDFKVNDDTGTKGQSRPAVTMMKNGSFVVCWQDLRNNEYDLSIGGFNYDIYAQYYDSDANAIGQNFRVNDDDGNRQQSLPCIATCGDSIFIIAWSDQRDGNDQIFAQKYNVLGHAIGSNIKVSDTNWAVRQLESSIAMNENGACVIVWQDDRYYKLEVYAQLYDSFGDTVGGNFKVNSDSLSSWRCPSVDMCPDGSFNVAWQLEENYDMNIYTRKFDALGVAMDTSIKVNDDTGSSEQWYPSISVNSEGMSVISWLDERDGKSNIYAQVYDEQGHASGENFSINSTIDDGYSWTFNPSVKMVNSMIYTSWYENRFLQKGYDIFYNVIEFKETSISDALPLSFALDQNYPNPFNPMTKISYELPEAENIKLQVFDIKGRLIETLIDGYKEAGRWNVTWDGSKYSSGIYVYRLQTGDHLESRKMLLIK